MNLNSFGRHFHIGIFRIPLLEKGASIESATIERFSDKPIQSLIDLPSYLQMEVTTLLNDLLIDKIEYDGCLKDWIGDPSTFEVRNSDFIILNVVSKIYQYAIRQSHRLDTIRFLSPISKNFPPLIQGVLSPVQIPKEILDLDFVELSYQFPRDISMLSPGNLELIKLIFDKAYKNPSILNIVEIDFINQIKELEIRFDFTRFQSPYEQFFGYGLSKLNLNHPLGNALFQVYAWIALAKIQKLGPTDKIGSMQDILYKIVNRRDIYIGGLIGIKNIRCCAKT